MRKIIILLLIGNIILVTGCWDMVEINERAFPYTVGLDINQEGVEKYEVTFSHPNITALGDQALDDDLIHVISVKGDSIFEASQNLTMELHQPLYFKHLKVLVMSRKLVENKQLLLETLDGVQRDFITNNNASLLVAESAFDLIDYTRETKIQQAIEGTIYSILINKQESNFFTPMPNSKFIQNMDQTGAAVIPIAGYEENIRIGGGAVFKDYEYVGDISPRENRVLNLINNVLNQDQMDVEHGGYNLALMITEGKTKKRLEDKKNLKINLEIQLEGHIHSHILREHEIVDEMLLRELEEMAEEVIQEDVEALIKRVQGDLNSDIIFVSDYLRKFHPRIWKEIEDDYDSIFPHMDIEAEVNFFIRRRGLVE